MLELIKQGGFVMYPLILCSIISLTVILERTFFWIINAKNRNNALVFNIIEMVIKKDFQRIKKRTIGSKDFIVRVLVNGILHKDFSASKAMEAAALEEIKKMSRFMNILDTIITVAPLLGILGTVVGIIFSFEMLGKVGISDPKVVTIGISQALITTASGLSIAIVTIFPYNYFRSKINKATIDLEQHSTSLEAVL